MISICTSIRITYLFGNIYKYKEDENTEGAFGVGLEIFMRNSNQFGAKIGASYEFSREIDSASGSIDGVTYNAIYSEPKPTFSFYTLFGDIVFFPTNELYLFGGLHLAKTQIKNTTIKADAGIGIQLGFGAFLNERFSLDIEYRATNYDFTSSEVISGVSYTQIGELYFQGVLISGKFFFEIDK